MTRAERSGRPTAGSPPQAAEGRPPVGGPQSLFYATSATVGLPRIVRGDGIHLWDEDGRRLIDVASGVFLTSLGQGNERVLQAMVEQGRRLTFSYVRNTIHDPNVQLADRIARLAGPGFERVHLSSGGSEANEMAIKFLRQYAFATGNPQRFRLISCMPSFHGATIGVLALNGDVELEPVYGPMVTFSSKIPAPLTYRASSPEDAARASAEALEAEILRLGPETVLAFVVEPVGGQATGANVPHPLFFREIRRICSAYGVFLVFDEVMSSVRTGKFLAAHFEPDALPDVVVIAKGLGAGYAPLGAVLAPVRLVDELAATTGFNLQHTYNANPIVCAAGCAVLDEIVERDLMERARTLGERLRAGLQGLMEVSPLVGDVRGKGLLLAIELVADRESATSFPAEVNVPERLRLAAGERGLLLYSRRQNSGRFGDWSIIAPPLVATEDDCDEIVERLGLALDDLAQAFRREGSPLTPRAETADLRIEREEEVSVRVMQLGRPRAALSDEAIFKGNVRLRELVGEEDARVIRAIEVTFEPEARTRWHKHSVEQVLIITSGHGVVATDEEEFPVRAGDVVLIPAEQRHWHGATGDTTMTHISILTPGEEVILDD